MLHNKLKSIFYNAVHKRCEPKKYLYYFTQNDFDGLHSKPITIKSSKGHKLKGYLYHYDMENLKDDRVIIFEHGMWSGHISYMREIELLCRHGYVVLGYDHTGCFESEGEETYGFLQSLLDLNDVIEHFKSNEELKDLKIYVVGHSWGGFSAMNISQLKKIEGFVAISGFTSVKDIINQNVPFFLPYSRKKLLEYEGQGSKYASVSGVRLKDHDTRALFIHSRDDKIVKYKKHHKKLHKALENCSDVTFLVLDGKGHNPTYSDEAVKLKDQMQADLTKALKEGKLSTDEECQAFVQKYDWNKITEQDKDVWDIIIHFLKD
ncbi:MAG: alpha/beta fold hydrolase [Clostridia bacterium]|nr:alpha/beta fold hydrolase [Clostridia bacterium]